MLYAKLTGRIALFTCENIAHVEFYLQGLLPKILAIYTIKCSTSRVVRSKELDFVKYRFSDRETKEKSSGCRVEV